MQLDRIGLVGAIAGVLLGGLVTIAGCEGADDEVGGGQAELRGGYPFHHWHRMPDAGSAGGSVGTSTGGSAGTSGISAPDGGAIADCDICTQAQQCCETVEANPECTFSAAKCSSMVGDALPAYINACLVFVNTVRGAWGGNPPAVCR